MWSKGSNHVISLAVRPSHFGLADIIMTISTPAMRRLLSCEFVWNSYFGMTVSVWPLRAAGLSVKRPGCTTAAPISQVYPGLKICVRDVPICVIVVVVVYVT